MQLRLGVVLVVLVSIVAAAQMKPERQVRDGQLISDADPAATLELGKAFQYAGGQVIDIGKVAGAEQHFFADAGPDGVVRRFFWIQFEHYYPGNQNIYDFAGITQQPVAFGAVEFMGDVRLRRLNPAAADGTGPLPDDAEKFLRAKGYTVDGTFVRARLFYLPDASRRKVLMVIYGEALAGTSEEMGRSLVLQHARETLKVRLHPVL